MEGKHWYEGVPAPVDKDGNVVPLDVKKLYASDGSALDVELVGFDGTWVVEFDGDGLFPLDWFHLAPPDTWERVEADLMAMARADCACYYFGAGADLDCGECPAESCSESCFVEAARDVLRRCKAIAGVA